MLKSKVEQLLSTQKTQEETMVQDGLQRKSTMVAESKTMDEIRAQIKRTSDTLADVTTQLKDMKGNTIDKKTFESRVSDLTENTTK